MDANAAFLLSLGLLVLGVAAKPSKSRWLHFPPILALGIFCYRNRLNEADTVPIGLLLVIASDFLLLTNVQRQITRTRTGSASSGAAAKGRVGNGNEKMKKIEEKGFMQRLAWSVYLVYSIRGIGWSHGRWVASCPSVQAGCSSRHQFIRSRLKWLLYNILFFLVAMAGIERNPSFHRESTDFAKQSLLWKTWSMFLFTGASTPLLSIGLNLIPGLVTVSLGISQPQDWPYLFGSAGSARSIRAFWGKTWHQLLRRPLTSHGKYVARTIGLKEGTDAAYDVQVIFAFLISGLIHTSSLSDLRPLQFFMLQAAGIVLETHLISLAQKHTSISSAFNQTNWDRIGFVWVWFWFIHTLFPFWNAMADSEVFGRGFNVLNLIWHNWMNL